MVPDAFFHGEPALNLAVHPTLLCLTFFKVNSDYAVKILESTMPQLELSSFSPFEHHWTLAGAQEVPSQYQSLYLKTFVTESLESQEALCEMMNGVQQRS